jgi:phosphate-selective porin
MPLPSRAERVLRATASRGSAATLLLAAALGVHGATAARAQTAPEPPSGDDGRFEWSTEAYVQLDVRSFSDWDLASGSSRLQHGEAELRRLRVGVEGSWREASFELSADPFDEDGVFIKDARVDLRLRDWARLRGGHFKLPGGREYATSSRRLGFLERSALSESLSAGRDLGGLLDLRLGAKVRLDLGLFAGDGLGRQDRAGLTSAGRVSFNPFGKMDLGASASLSGVAGVADSDQENSINGWSSTGYRLFDRLYVQGRRTRTGADAQWIAGPWRLNAEVLRLREQRSEQAADYTDLPDLVANAVTVSARFDPGRPQLGLRYERLSFDDVGPATEMSGVRPRVSDVRPRGVEGLTLCAGWRLLRWLLVVGETSAEWYSEPRSAPSPGREGPYLTFGARLQVERR